MRLVRIDIMVGLAMLFVVVGHLSVGFEPRWYSVGLHSWIYSFHMEMFFFLSAFLIRYTYKGIQSPLEYAKYIWRKFKKFFVWFFIIGMTVSIIAPLFRHEPLSASSLWQSLRTLLLYPRWSEASFLWYIYVLFGFYLISPLFFRLPQLWQVLCCIAAMFLAMHNGGSLFAADEFCQYTFFYCFGVLCAEWIDEIRSFKLWMWASLSTPFIAFSIWVFTAGYNMGFTFRQLQWWTLVTGMSSLPFFYFVTTGIQKVKSLSNAFSAISRNCYIIYLLQMFVIWTCTWAIKQFGLTDTIPFIVFMAVTSTMAILIPIAIAHFYRKLTANK